MSTYIENILKSIDKMSSYFDNTIVDENGKIDTKILFSSISQFFDKIDEIRNDAEFKEIMRKT